MSGQKIIIDPMIPHYQMYSSVSGSKGGKSDRNNSLSLSKSSTLPSYIPQHIGDMTTQEAVEDAEKHTSVDSNNKEIMEAEKSGIHAAITETVREHRRNTFKFFGLLNKSEKLVYKIKNIIPIFRSEVLIDTAKITFIFRPFFFSERIHSISIKDISDVYVETIPFFATINVVDTNFTETLIRQKWFWKRDAERARRIITGLMAAAREGVDLKNIEDDALTEKLEEIGKLRSTSTSVSAA